MFNPEFAARARAKRKGLEMPAEMVLPSNAKLMRGEARAVLREVRALLQVARREREQATLILADARHQAKAIVEEAVIVLRAAGEGRRIIPDGAARKPAGEVIAEVAARFDVPVSAILSDTREHRIAAARHEAILTLHTLRGDLNMTDLGRIFRRDRTSIVHALKKARK